jgi:hypothetical protein
MGEFEVERIIGKKNTPKGVEYQVKWKGYPMSECTWEPERNLTTCKEMIDEYKKRNNLATTNDLKSKNKPMKNIIIPT